MPRVRRLRKWCYCFARLPLHRGSDWFDEYLWIRAVVGQNRPRTNALTEGARRPSSQIPERTLQSEGGEVSDQLVLRRPNVLELQTVAVDGHAQPVGLLDREGRALRSRIRLPP